MAFVDWVNIMPPRGPRKSLVRRSRNDMGMGFQREWGSRQRHQFPLQTIESHYQHIENTAPDSIGNMARNFGKINLGRG